MVRGWISSPKKLQEKFRRTLVLRLFLMENSSNLRLRHNKRKIKKFNEGCFYNDMNPES